MRTEKVSFYSEGIKLAGVLYLPDSDKGKPFAGIVQGPGFLGLKDAKHYIMMFEKLCAAGYACLCFDYRGWGDSEGNDRGWVMPKWQAEDIRNAITFMQTRAEIDPDRIATYGSGGTGGGNAVYVAALDSRVNTAPSMWSIKFRPGACCSSPWKAMRSRPNSSLLICTKRRVSQKNSCFTKRPPITAFTTITSTTWPPTSSTGITVT
jgi:predicted alpha/beta hydrolase